MSKTILQVPLNKELKTTAERVALSQGFSSLQEAVRLFLNKLAKGNMQVTFEETVHLSKKAQERYNASISEVTKDKHVHEAKDAEDFIEQLHHAPAIHR